MSVIRLEDESLTNVVGGDVGGVNAGSIYETVVANNANIFVALNLNGRFGSELPKGDVLVRNEHVIVISPADIVQP